MRRAQVTLGLLAACLAGAGMVYDLFGPTYVYSGCTGGQCQSGVESLWQVGIEPGSFLYLSFMLALFIAVAVVD